MALKNWPQRAVFKTDFCAYEKSWRLGANLASTGFLRQWEKLAPGRKVEGSFLNEF
jgi:hypothetical protein